MYITQEHNRWPRTAPRIAARLRQVLDLPGLSVKTRRDHVTITWIGGPEAAPVFLELRDRLSGVISYRAVRLYPVAVFGAALLAECRPPFDVRQFEVAWRLLHRRDLHTDPFDDALVARGAVLAANAGAPSTAHDGWRRRRWDWEMWQSLRRLGDPGILEMIIAPAGA